MHRPEIKHKDPLTLPIQILPELMQDVLARGAYFRFRARGSSMYPFIKDGDIVTIAPKDKEKPGVGKVVAFIQPAAHHLMVHRIVNRNRNAFLIKGDNSSNQSDGWIDEKAIFGCVVKVERGGRRVRLGNGFERYLIALVSRSSWLRRILSSFRALFFPRR